MSKYHKAKPWLTKFQTKLGFQLGYVQMLGHFLSSYKVRLFQLFYFRDLDHIQITYDQLFDQCQIIEIKLIEEIRRLMFLDHNGDGEGEGKGEGQGEGEGGGHGPNAGPDAGPDARPDPLPGHPKMKVVALPPLRTKHLMLKGRMLSIFLKTLYL